jgi:multidrug efflux pump subunit AcrA (membrane-fusion protein)
VTYLAQQRDKVKVQLDQADAALTAFQQQHGIADITAQIAGAVKENDTLRQNEADALASLADRAIRGRPFAARWAIRHRRWSSIRTTPRPPAR